ncbi:hypothetical protein ACJ41O_013624 [Fusarium nematophilum]
MGHSDSKPDLTHMPTELAKSVPPVIRFSYQNSWKKLICFSRVSLQLSEPDSEPTYSISFPRGWYGDVVLHSGPDPESSAQLSRATREGTCSSDYSIFLPLLPGSPESTRNLEILRHPSGRKGKWWFAMQVGQGPSTHVERFEWRRSRGSEVKSVGQSGSGWKLVRLGGGKMQEEEYSSDEEVVPDHGDGFASDGKEVVAVWASSSSWKTLSGVGEFQLRGSGATGELGRLWALMAVMSCVSVWQKHMRDAATAGASASSSSAATSVAIS